jgi:hypothetical protein
MVQLFFDFGFRRSRVRLFSPSFQTRDSVAFADIIGSFAPNFSSFSIAPLDFEGFPDGTDRAIMTPN